MKSKIKKQSWIVKIEHTVVKEIICDNCTEEQARNTPWEHCIDEREIDSKDWEVLKVEPNT